MRLEQIQPLQKVCQKISEIKQQMISEDLLHSGKEALYFNNDEITTGLINNKIEIKIHLLTGKLVYFNNERGHYINLYKDNISDSLKKITDRYDLKPPEEKLGNVSSEMLSSFHAYAVPAKRLLELFRNRLENNFTLVHLWPHHFDFSVEWFTGKPEEQIGTGISPGDKDNANPYLYMNPYPFNEKLIENKIPLGTWNLHGSKGMKIELKELLNYSPENAADKLNEAFAVVKKNFGLSN